MLLVLIYSAILPPDQKTPLARNYRLNRKAIERRTCQNRSELPIIVKEKQFTLISPNNHVVIFEEAIRQKVGMAQFLRLLLGDLLDSVCVGHIFIKLEEIVADDADQILFLGMAEAVVKASLGR